MKAETANSEIDNLLRDSKSSLDQGLKKSISHRSELIERRCRRERLVVYRLLIAKLSLITSVASIVVMVVNTQLILMDVYPTCSVISLTLKRIITCLTTLLIIFIWSYNYLQQEIFRNLRNIVSRRIAIQVNPQRTILLFVETLITLPHPLPFCLRPSAGAPVSPYINEHEAPEGNVTSEIKMFTERASSFTYSNATTGEIPPLHISRLNQWDSAFAVLMFLRLYHIARFTVLHSKLFRTMLSYSLGALAHTKYNFMFIFKSYMAIYKGYFLAALALAFTFIAAWCIYICDKDITNYEDALWVVGITFFTVGYGDISPVSRYSQIIAVMTGFSGMFFMGISVTILSRYLQLTYDEYCMLAFFIDADLQKKRREVSALIVQAAWKQYKDGKRVDALTRYKSQRKLMKALHLKKNIDYQKITGRERREKQVTCNNPSALFYNSSDVPLYDMKEQMKKLTIRTDHVFRRETKLEKSIEVMRQRLLKMQEKLGQLCKILQKEKRPPLLTTTTLPEENLSSKW